ncbi:MAG: S9 family peptidase [Chitinophagaceae bacterium]|nr:S9 family peptidase [Chitinophagaceae bacterium]
MIHRILFIVFLFSIVSASAQTKKVITHEDMWLMKRVGAPEISANGKWVVFSVTDAAYDEKDQTTDLWIAAADGSSKPRKLTATKTGESNYTWSPDSKMIAFTAKREGDDVAQVYVINVADGGESQRITNISTGAAAPKWSPDGTMLLFTSKVYHGAFTDSANKKTAEEKKKIKYKVREYNSFPIRDWDQWIDEKETHLFVQKAEAGAIAKDLFSTATIVNEAGFKIGGNACWSANGNEIIFTATTELNKSVYKEPAYNIYSVSVNDAAFKKLTADEFEYSDVAASRDGKYLYCQSAFNNNYKVYNLQKLTRFDWPAMTNKTWLAAELDRPVNKYVLNGNAIVMSVEYEGNDRLFTIAANETAAKPLTNNTTGCYNNISVSTDNIIVSNYESASSPAEVVKISGTAHGAITDFNKDKLAALDLQTIETFWYSSSRGKKIRSILARPAGFDAAKKYPLFVVMHGGPAGAWKDNWGYRWNYQLLASPGYVLVMTDYTGSTGYGEKFSQDIQYDPFKGPGAEINEAAAYAIKNYSFIDGTKQAAGGASYGGHLANWMQATTTHYKCLISHAGLMNSESQWGTSDAIYNREVMNGGTPWMPTKSWKEQNPIRYAAKFKTPVLITVGEQDFRVPLNNSIENFHVLQRLQIPSKLVVFPEENHWVLKAENSRFFYKEVQEWLRKYLK